MPHTPSEPTPLNVVETPLPAAPQKPHRKIILFAGIVLASVVIGAISLIWHRQRTTQPNVALTSPSPTPSPIRTEKNILLLGYGGGGHAGGKLTDTIMIASLRPEERTIALISLPRDLWVQLPILGETLSGWKLNAAFAIGADDKNYRFKSEHYTGTHGGGALAKFAVTKVTGLPIDGYVAVDFASFVRTVDLVGGIDVVVEKTFDDYQYPIEGEEENTCGKSPEELLAIEATASAEVAEKLFPCRYEHLHFDRGLQHMDGETALKFARSRHSAQDGNDFGRSQRQKLVILALKDKMLDIRFLPKLPGFVGEMLGKLSTDVTLGDFTDLLAKKDEYNGYKIVNISLTDKNVLVSGRSSTGAYVLLPREGEEQFSGIQQFIEAELASASAHL